MNILLLVVYYAIATPLGLVSRLVHDPLARRRRKHASTYWTVPAAAQYSRADTLRTV